MFHSVPGLRHSSTSPLRGLHAAHVTAPRTYQNCYVGPGPALVICGALVHENNKPRGKASGFVYLKVAKSATTEISERRTR